MKIGVVHTKASCTLGSDASLFCRRVGLTKQDKRDDWLTQMGLTCDEIQGLDIRQPLLQEIAEYAGLGSRQALSLLDMTLSLEATHMVIENHIREIEQQMWMLQHRKVALENKAVVIERIMRILRPITKNRAA